MAEKRKVEMVLDYQNYIETPPIKPAAMYGNACSSDTVTIDSWRKIWCKNLEDSHKHFGNWAQHSIGKLFNLNKNKPAIIVGSGPSLAYNGERLKNRGDIVAVSCLHNFHYFVDREIPIDYYVSLDAGPVVLEEIAEGGSKSAQEYWDLTRDKKLCAFLGSPVELFQKWQGEIYLFNAPVPDQTYMDTVDRLEPFNVYVSNGGNVLGACLYVAKGFLGSNPIAFTGADFAFSYDTGKGVKFHGWDSKYDKTIGNVMKAVDVFGNKVLTWPSYNNFKNFFDFISLQIPGLYINCTEGGTLGAYAEGNLMSIRQMALSDFITMYQMNDMLRVQCENPGTTERKLLF